MSEQKDGTSPFWGRAAAMGIMSHTGYILDRDSLVLPAEGIPLCRKPHPFESDYRGGDVVGRIDHMWYGDESGLQVILFDGVWITPFTMGRDFLKEYPELKYPSLYITGFQHENDEDGHMHVTEGYVRQVTLTDGAAQDGLFIRSEPLPETLRNRGRII